MDKFSELKAIAEKAKELGGINNYAKGKAAVLAFQAAANPSVVLALLAELEAKDKRIAEAEVRGVEKLAAAFKSWASDETFPDCEAQRHWATASREALSFAGDLRNGSCDDR